MVDNSLTKNIIGIGIEVHKKIGPGFTEKIYQRAFEILLKNKKIQFKREKRFNIIFENKTIGWQTVDFIIEDKLIVELKALETINNLHISQTLSYLKATNNKLGLILNFGQSKLQIKRVIL